MGWLFNLGEKENKTWMLTTLGEKPRILFEGSQNECKRFYKENIYKLYIDYKLKYIFKSSNGINKYKIDLTPIFEEYKKENLF